MNKVFVDFEMQPIEHIHTEERKIVFHEIIQIGAVMLDENDEEIETFNEIVRPVFTIEGVHSYLRDLTGIRYSMIRSADGFETVFNRFLKWCGSHGDYTVYAWSGSDLKQLKGELKLKNVDITKDITYMLTNWIDLQAEFDEIIGSKKLIGLSKALQMSGVDFKGKKHNALYDSRNTAEVYRAMQDKDALIKSVRYTEEMCNHDEPLGTIGSMFDMSAIMAAIA